jgi:diguanylate cyclase (GGDEF)-like protein
MTSCLDADQIHDLIGPMTSRLPGAGTESSIRDVVTEILACAQSFVPSEAGSLMMSHPDQEGALMFIASFGMGADKLPGTALPPGAGIAGQVYLSGQPVLTNNPAHDTNFYREIDRLTEHETHSLLCVPLRAFGQSVGVLSLLNREGGRFEERDLDLLKVFCQYLTQSIQLMLEAKRQREAAFKDHLTGLFNDRYFYQCLSELVKARQEDGRDVGLLFLDLDHFKSVVDTHGHLVGSQALREVGLMIGVIAREHGAIPARYGGDEYVVVVDQATPQLLETLAEKIRRRIESAELVCEGEGGGQVVVLKGAVTASVGVASLSRIETENMSVEAVRQRLIRVADSAMYAAKALGKNRVAWYTEAS